MHSLSSQCVQGIGAQCLVIAALVTSWLLPCNGVNVLISQCVSTGSHELILRNIGEHLSRQGHRVSQIRMLSAHNRFMPDNSTVEIVTVRARNDHGQYSHYDGDGVFIPSMNGVWGNSSQLFLVSGMSDVAVGYCDSLLVDQRLLQQLRHSKFQVALVDTIGNQCGFALARILGLPVVGFTVVSPHGTDQGDFVSWLNPPSVSVVAFSQLEPGMVFLERVWNVLTYSLQMLLTYCLQHISLVFIRQHHPDWVAKLAATPTVDAYVVYQNFLVTQPVVLSANSYTAGFCPSSHSTSHLTSELKTLFDRSSEGVVIFSMGLTLYEPDLIPSTFIKSFLDAFGKLKQTVVMRFHLPESMSNFTVASNIVMVQWLPQVAALGHRNTKLFVTHGGISGVMEGVYHAVPLMVVPLFGDQFENAKVVESRGYGLSLGRWSLTSESVLSTAEKIIEDKCFKQRVKRAAEIWRSFDCPGDLVSRLVSQLTRRGRPRSANLYTDHHLWMAPLAVGTMFWFLVSIALTIIVSRHIQRRLLV